MIKFLDLDKILGRSLYSCYRHWHVVLMPILLTHGKGLPIEMNWNWRDNVRQYIIKEQIKHHKDLDYHHLIREICPGQTYQSVDSFIQQFRYRKNINDASSLFFYKLVAERARQLPLYPKIVEIRKEKKRNKFKESSKCYSIL